VALGRPAHGGAVVVTPAVVVVAAVVDVAVVAMTVVVTADEVVTVASSPHPATTSRTEHDKIRRRTTRTP
jgi:hypothetical protein